MYDWKPGGGRGEEVLSRSLIERVTCKLNIEKQVGVSRVDHGTEDMACPAKGAPG